jgi:large subunit ribosomal protein L16|tara:strand:- start:1239 stop:1676 length:438 start_codon:yes stop_codon:yes gene_type:complete
MLLPKRTKYKKQQKKKLTNFFASSTNNINGKNNLHFGDFGIIAKTSGRLTSRQIEATRIAIKRKIKPNGKLWINIFPSVPISGKPTQIRMGKGKGFTQYWVAKVSIGMVLFEISNIIETTAFKALRSGINKLPISCSIIQRKHYV